jgi:hypothetical protein
LQEAWNYKAAPLLRTAKQRYVKRVLLYLQLTNQPKNGFAKLIREFERSEAFAVTFPEPPS